MHRQLDRVKGKVQSIKKDDDDRKAKLLEIEHLEGWLIVDNISRLKREIYRKKIRKALSA